VGECTIAGTLGRQATPHGQIVYFVEFLATAGIFDNGVKACPLHYTSPNASSVRDVLGPLMLGVLSGSKRYAHLAGIRGEQVAAQALGQKKADNVKRLTERLFRRQVHGIGHRR